MTKGSRYSEDGTHIPAITFHFCRIDSQMSEWSEAYRLRKLYCHYGRNCGAFLLSKNNQWNGDTLVLQDLRSFVSKHLLKKFLLNFFLGLPRSNDDDFLDKGRTIAIIRIIFWPSWSFYDKNLRRRRGKLSKCILFLQDDAFAHKSHVAM